MSERYLNRNYLAKACDRLYEMTDNSGYEKLAVIFGASDEVFNVFFPEASQTQIETDCQFAPEA